VSEGEKFVRRSADKVHTLIVDNAHVPKAGKGAHELKKFV